MFPFSRNQKKTSEPPQDDGLVQILVRLGKVSPFVLGALMTSLAKTQPDDEVVQQLVRRRVVTNHDVEVAKQVQAKLRAGQPIYEEWAKLEDLMEENRRCAQELTDVISQRKDKRRRRGEDTVLFLTPRQGRLAT